MIYYTSHMFLLYPCFYFTFPASCNMSVRSIQSEYYSTLSYTVCHTTSFPKPQEHVVIIHTPPRQGQCPSAALARRLPQCHHPSRSGCSPQYNSPVRVDRSSPGAVLC